MTKFNIEPTVQVLVLVSISNRIKEESKLLNKLRLDKYIAKTIKAGLVKALTEGKKKSKSLSGEELSRNIKQNNRLKFAISEVEDEQTFIKEGFIDLSHNISYYKSAITYYWDSLANRVGEDEANRLYSEAKQGGK